jgi:hypothetical protein
MFEAGLGSAVAVIYATRYSATATDREREWEMRGERRGRLAFSLLVAWPTLPDAPPYAVAVVAAAAIVREGLEGFGGLGEICLG